MVQQVKDPTLLLLRLWLQLWREFHPGPGNFHMPRAASKKKKKKKKNPKQKTKLIKKNPGLIHQCSFYCLDGNVKALHHKRVWYRLKGSQASIRWSWGKNGVKPAPFILSRLPDN